MSRSSRKGAFTLIELLIVVAIIAILALIAVPNFLEAQTRAKVSRIRADFRSVTTAIEAYRVDFTDYPIDPLLKRNNYNDEAFGPLGAYTQLTTPVAYITSVDMRDPFKSNMGHRANQPFQAIGVDWISYAYVHLPEKRIAMGIRQYPAPPVWMLQSPGPDHIDSGHANPSATGRGSVAAYARIDPATDYYWCRYDPTNGTASEGDILRFGP